MLVPILLREGRSVIRDGALEVLVVRAVAALAHAHAEVEEDRPASPRVVAAQQAQRGVVEANRRLGAFGGVAAVGVREDLLRAAHELRCLLASGACCRVVHRAWIFLNAWAARASDA